MLNFPLRACGIGDSMMAGVGGSTDRTGCLNILQASLVAHSVATVLVGSQTVVGGGGHEGHPGWRTTDIRANIPFILTAQAPSIIWLMAGANDLFSPDWTPDTRGNAANNMNGLLETIRLISPLTKVIVSTIPVPSAAIAAQVAATQTTAIWFNAALRKIAADHCAIFVDPNLIVPTPTADSPDLADGMHPSNSGYDKIAAAFYQATLALVAADAIMLPDITVQAAAGTGPFVIPSLTITINGQTYGGQNLSLPSAGTGTFRATNVPLLRTP